MDSLPVVWALAKIILEIEDEYQTERVASILNEESGLIHLSKLIRLPSRKFCIIRKIFEWGKGAGETNGLMTVTKYLATVQESVLWMEDWMQTYLRSKTENRDGRNPKSPGNNFVGSRSPNSESELAPPAPEARDLLMPRSP